MPRTSRSPLGVFFRALNKLSESELAERYGVREWTEKLVYWGTRTGAQVGAQAGAIARSRFTAAQERLHEFSGAERFAAPRSRPGGRFDLTLTEEQSMMRETLRRFARETARPAAQAADREGADAEFDARVAELGLNLISVPEGLGGAGEARSPVSTTLIAEDLAYGDMGLALAALAPCGFINLLVDYGTQLQRRRYLPPMCDEDFVPASLALMEPRARFDARYLETRARPEGAGFRLEGTKCMVPLAERAEVFLVFAQLAGQGPRAFLVDATNPLLERRAERHMGLGAAGLGRLELRGALVGPDALLGGPEPDAYDHARALDLARLGTCALAVGACQAVLDYVITYCNERVAFGEPISHKQAVAFMIADIAIELEGMRLMTYQAASHAERGRPFHREAFLAWTQCAEKAMQLGSQGVQLLGGHGYTAEHPVERWYRQLRAVAILEGALAV